MNQRYIILLMESLLLLAAIFSVQPWAAWLLFQLSVLPQFLGSRRLVSGLLSSVLVGTGYWIGLPSADPFLHQVGVVFLCVGIGGLLGWFPLPRTQHFRGQPNECVNHLGGSLIPVCVAAKFIYRSIQHFTWSEQNLAILAVISLFSLGLCGIRLLGPLSMPQRVRLSILTILSNANIASILMGWVKLYPERTWINSSNLPSAEFLFQAILIIESLAAIVFILSLQRMAQPEQGSDLDESLVERMASHPWVKKFVIVSNLSLAGFPLFPGAIWRFVLIGTLILPQARSNVTQIAEPQHGFIILSIAFVIATIVVSLGQMRLIQRLVCEQHETPEVVTASAS